MKTSAPEIIAGLAAVGIRQRDLAERFGVTEHTIGRWARGQTEPTRYQMSSLRRLIGRSWSVIEITARKSDQRFYVMTWKPERIEDDLSDLKNDTAAARFWRRCGVLNRDYSTVLMGADRKTAKAVVDALDKAAAKPHFKARQALVSQPSRALVEAAAFPSPPLAAASPSSR